MGYSETLNAYQIYIPTKRKVVVRQNVKFEEERAFRRSQRVRVFRVTRPSGAIESVTGIQFTGCRKSGIRSYIDYSVRSISE